MRLEIGADKQLDPIPMRLGPFAKQPKASSVRVNGRIPEGASIEHNGDSWWIKFKSSIGPVP